MLHFLAITPMADFFELVLNLFPVTFMSPNRVQPWNKVPGGVNCFRQRCAEEPRLCVNGEHCRSSGLSSPLFSHLGFVCFFFFSFFPCVSVCLTATYPKPPTFIFFFSRGRLQRGRDALVECVCACVRACTLPCRKVVCVVCHNWRGPDHRANK